MTDEEISAMEAGREMDVLIAEKAMGFEIMRPIGKSRDGEPTYRHRCPDNDWDWFETTVPHYSTDIAAAWQVVETLCADGHNFSFDGGAFAPGSDWSSRPEKWTVSFDDFTTFEVHGYASTMPLAICRGALKAVADWPDEQNYHDFPLPR